MKFTISNFQLRGDFLLAIVRCTFSPSVFREYERFLSYFGAKMEIFISLSNLLFKSPNFFNNLKVEFKNLK